MVVREYGKNNKDVIILLHGGGLSWWCYEEVAKLLENKYHVVLPILDGHAESDFDFTTIDNNSNEIIKYIDENYNGKVKLIGGISLGAQILLDILIKRDDICDFAMIESALVYPMKITNRLIPLSINLSYFLISKRWFSKIQFNSLKMNKRLFDRYYNDSSSITKSNMISILKANTNYCPDNMSKIKTNSLVLVGNKEKSIMVLSANKIHNKLINSELEILDGYYHGELSINHPDEYVSKLKDLIKNK